MVTDVVKIISLNQNYEFKRIYNKGKSVVQPYFVLYVRRNILGFNRLGITVSKKMGKAVVRNRIRRRLKEIYRLNCENLKRGYDIVIVGRGRAEKGKYDSITEAFKGAAKNAGIWK